MIIMVIAAATLITIVLLPPLPDRIREIRDVITRPICAAEIHLLKGENRFIMTIDHRIDPSIDRGRPAESRCSKIVAEPPVLFHPEIIPEKMTE